MSRKIDDAVLLEALLFSLAALFAGLLPALPVLLTGLLCTAVDPLVVEPTTMGT